MRGGELRTPRTMAVTRRPAPPILAGVRWCWPAGPPAVDRPAAFTIDGPNTQHVLYRGNDNQIHEITW